MVGNKSSLHKIIEDLLKEGKCRRKFMTHLFSLFLTIRGRINFTQMAQFGSFNETTYHTHFGVDFEFRDFNRKLAQGHGSGKYVIIFDPSHLPKSGKKTPDMGWFWSGCAGRPKQGLEIGGLAVGDLENRTAFHLEAVQTPCGATLKSKGKTQMEHYQELILRRQSDLKALSNYLAADGFFAKYGFVTTVHEQTGMHIISCLRTDAVLYYLHEGGPTGRKGRPKVKDERVDVATPDEERLPIAWQNERVRLRSALVWCKSLKRKIRLVLTEFLHEDGSLFTRKLLFSTDLKQDPAEIFEYYGCRFQIEFLYRDAKQFAGLTHCQSRNEEKLNFHFNAALTTVSLAKAAHWLPIPKEERGPFSMQSIKAYYHNEFLLERFSYVLNLDLTRLKMNPKIKELMYIGARAA